MLGDGNCFFRAVAKLIYRNDARHEWIRSSLVNFVEAHWHRFKEAIRVQYACYGKHNITKGEYCKKIRANREYADNFEVRAMAEMLASIPFV